MARRELTARRVLVTGATDGLGLLLARAYAERGHTVLATGRQNLPDQAAHFGDERIRYIRADQADPDLAAERLGRGVASLDWDGIDLAILNAGLGWEGAADAETAGNIAKQIDVNLTSTVLMAHTVAPHLLAAKGRLVLIGSSLHKGHPRFATYAATKAGLAGFAKSLREEWRGKAGVTLVHPGPTKTAMPDKAGMDLGVARRFFMSAERAARAIQKSARDGDAVRAITRTYALTSRFGQAGELEL